MLIRICSPIIFLKLCVILSYPEWNTLPHDRTLPMKSVMHYLISKVIFPDVLLTIISMLYYNNNSEVQIIKGPDIHLLVDWGIANISFLMMLHKLQNLNIKPSQHLEETGGWILLPLLWRGANETEPITEDQVQNLDLAWTVFNKNMCIVCFFPRRKWNSLIKRNKLSQINSGLLCIFW